MPSYASRAELRLYITLHNTGQQVRQLLASYIFAQRATTAPATASLTAPGYREQAVRASWRRRIELLHFLSFTSPVACRTMRTLKAARRRYRYQQSAGFQARLY